MSKPTMPIIQVTRSTLLALFVSTLAGTWNTTHAQLTVQPQDDLQALAAAITGPGVTILNPVINCGDSAYGEFSYSGSTLGLQDGVVLTTGWINDALGPNNNGGTTRYNSGTGGDALLDAVTGRDTYNRCRFEFDIIPSGDSLRFNFVFASEEYNEWVGSQYNDVFGFFISGPGITGDPGIGNDKNIALIPGTSQAVAINNVNNGLNEQYFFDNTGGSEIQYDGLTQGLYAESRVTPCQTYHLKLIVADASDRWWDSGVFIERIRSNEITMSSHTLNGTPNMVEGCNPGWVTFTRNTSTASALNLTYFLQGTATNGVDYSAIGNVNPSVPKLVTIPMGQTSVNVNVNPTADAVNEGNEFLRFILGNPFCPANNLDTLIFNVTDTLIATLSPLNPTICRGDSVQLVVTGGANYAWSPAGTLSASNIADPWASPTVNTLYQVAVTEGTCLRNIRTTVRVSDIALSGVVTTPLCAGAQNGAINLTTTGGVAPYLFAWTGPGGFTSSSEDLVNIGAGTYTVSVTDGNGCDRTRTFVVNEPTILSGTLTPSIQPFGENISCNGDGSGSLGLNVTGGTVPYGVSWVGPASFTSNNFDLVGIGAGNYEATVTDANGCQFIGSFNMTQPDALIPSISGIQNVVCHGDGLGTAVVNATGGRPPYSYSWNSVPPQSTASATSLPSGTWTVTVTDAYGCHTQAQASVGGPTAPLVTNTTSLVPVSCSGGNSGSAVITATGGTAPYTYTWNTSPAQNGPSATNLTAGTWTCSVTDANGCSRSHDVTIGQPLAPLTLDPVSQTNIACHGQNIGQATVVASGGTAPYSYNWNTPPTQTTATASNLGAGSWSCTVTDARGCTAVHVVTITQPAAPLSASISAQTNVACFADNSGSATVQVAGGSAPYTVIWNTTPAQIGTTATTLIAGTWTCTVTDAQGCSTFQSVTITQPTAALQTTASSATMVACHGNASGSAGIGVSGGTAPYTYAWNTTPAQTNATATGLPAGTWTCVVSDAQGCTTQRAFTITEPSGPLSASLASLTPVLCFGNASGEASVAVSGGTVPYTYAWNTTPVQNTATASGLTAGTWTCTVTDQQGCSITQDAVVNSPAAALSSSVTSIIDVLCHGLSTGSAAIAAAGGTAPYTYAWNSVPPQSGPSATNLPAGSFTCTITDAQGCTSSRVVVITQPTASLTVSGSTVAAVCQGAANGAVDITISGGTTPYASNWTGPNGFFSASQDIASLEAGVYDLVITDGNGCANSTSWNVNQPGLFTVSTSIATYVGGVNVSCAGASDGSIDLTVSGATPPYQYDWNGPDGYTASSQDVSGLEAGTYTVIITDDNGCSTSETLTLSAPLPYSIGLTSATMVGGFNIGCFGAASGSIDATVQGGTAPIGLAWTGPAAFVATAEDINSLIAGNYTLTVTDANSCQADQTILLTQPDALQVTASVSATVSCNGGFDGSAQASVSQGVAPYTIIWSTTPTQNGPLATGLGAGTYTVSVNDANGCLNNASVTINEPALALSATIASVVNVNCHGQATGSAAVSATGGTSPYAFAWDTTPPQTSATATGLAAGNYTCTITDARGCTTSVTASVSGPAEPLSLSVLTITPVRCHGGSSGAATVVASGGTGNHSYVWNTVPPRTGPTLDQVVAGNYTVSVSDENGCSTSLDLTISEPNAALSASLINTVDQTCFASPTGQASVAAVGGSAPYTYAWSTTPVQTSSTAVGLQAGSYTVIITDSRLCTTTVNATIAGPAAPLSASITSVVDVLCFGGNTGSATGVAIGGTPPYAYLWNSDPASTTTTINGQLAGTYVFNVTDANGCTGATTATIGQPVIGISGSLESISMASCFGGADGYATIGFVGGSGNYDVVWNTVPPQFGTAISGLPAGTYLAQVTDQNGCSEPKFFPITITQPAAPLAISLVPQVFGGGFNTTCSNSADGSINATITGGSAPYSVTWITPLGASPSTEDIFGLSAGTYAVNVTDDQGCVANATITLTSPVPLDIATQVTPAACQGAATGVVDLSASGGVSPYLYDWNGPNGFSANTASIAGLSAGVYQLGLTDANGCPASFAVDVNQPGIFTISAVLSSFNGDVEVSCHDASDGSIDVTVSGGTPGYTYAWSGPGGMFANSQDLDALAPGSYQLTLTDANGCSSSVTYDLVAPAPLNAALSASLSGQYAIGCNGGSNGSITATIVGGVGPYSLMWSGPNGFSASTSTISGLLAGTYDLSVTDVNGCNSSASITLQQPDPINASITSQLQANGDAISCNGSNDGGINLGITGGQGPYLVLWTGPNGFSSTDQDLSGLAAGTYTVTITDAQGCTANGAITLTEPAPFTLGALIPTAIGGTAIDCPGSTNGSIDLTVTGGAGSFLYAWTGTNAFAAITEDVSGLGAGSYTVSVTDLNGCTAQSFFVLDEPQALTANASIINTRCQGNADGAIDLVANGGTSPYTYMWSSGFGLFSSTDEDLIGIPAAVYTVIITDANGCFLQRSFNVDEPDQFSMTGLISQYPGGYNVSCPGSEDGRIVSIVTGGTLPYQYTWLGSQGIVGTASNISELPAGTYELILTDQNGCSGLSTFELVEADPITIGLLPYQYPGGANTTCNATLTGSIDATIVGGVGPYTLDWQGPGGFSSSQEDLTNLGAGGYALLVTDLAGCTGAASITLNEPEPLSSSAVTGSTSGGNGLNCNGAMDGTIDLTIIGGTAPYQIIWSGPDGFGSTNNDLTGLGAGTYTATISDINGCTSTASATITAPNAIQIVLSATEFSGGFHVPCSGSSVAIVQSTVSGGTADYSYSWIGPNGFTSSAASLIDVSAGNYTLTVTDANGCDATASITLLQPNVLAASGTAGTTGNGFEVSCLGNDGTISISMSGGTLPYQFEWTGPDGFASSLEDLSGVAAGSYDLIVEDDNGCATSIGFVLTGPAPIGGSITPSTVICNGNNDGTIDLEVTGGSGIYTYAWTGPNGASGSTQDLSDLEGGSYTVVVNDDGNCTATFSTDIIVSGAMSAEVYRSNYGAVNIPCHGDSSGVIELSITGGTAPLDITWTGPNGFTSTGTDLSGLPEGTYAFTITDDNGCTLDSTIVLTAPQEELGTALTATLQASGTNISCNGGSDGSIEASVQGGNAPYTYLWRGPNEITFTTSTITDLPAGDYELVVTDTNACISTVNITLTEPAAPITIDATLSNYNGAGISCSGSSDGSIATIVTGGSPDLTFSWSGPSGFTSAADSLFGLEAGTYTVLVTDINGCSLSLPVTLTAPTVLETELNVGIFNGGTNVSCEGAEDGSIAQVISGGTGQVSVMWEGPDGFSSAQDTLTDLSAGNYCVTLTDANGCSTVACQMLIAPSTLVVGGTATPAACGLANGAVDASITGGTGPYDLVWNNGATDEDLSSIAPGTYSVDVTDANGCTANTTVIVIGTAALQAVISANDVRCHQANDGTIVVTPITGEAPYSYDWDHGPNTASVSDLAPGSYTVLITDANGCSLSTSASIAEPTAIDAVGEVSTYDNGYSVSTYLGTDGSITTAVSGGSGPYEYAWAHGPSTADVNGLSAGTYVVTITDVNGCSIQLEFVLDEPNDLGQPTGFTPNGDGQNDRYHVRGLDAFDTNQMTVFNRWGNVVYERVNYRNDWTGENMTGEPLPNGTYFVIITIPDAGQTLQNYVDLRR